MSVELFENLRHRFINVTGDQVHIHAFLLSCPTFLTCLIAKLLSLWIAPFICTELMCKYFLHKTDSFVKTKFYASSLLFCRVFAPLLLLPFSTMVLTRVHPSSCLVQTSHTSLAQHAFGKEQKIPIFHFNVVW